jgi:hypothetical protein
MPTIYAKTDRGLAEFETRAYRLHPRLRTVLILINGKRSDLELVQMLHHAAEGIVMLLEGGFIEPVAHVELPFARSDPYSEPLNLDETLPTEIPLPSWVEAANSRGDGHATGHGPGQGLRHGHGPDHNGGNPDDSGMAHRHAVVQEHRFSFDTRRRELLRLFNDHTGPAGQPLAERMERSLSPSEMRALLPAAVLLVDEIRGRPAAEAFAVRAEAF